MATETLFNYRHKKFDQHNRMRENKLDSSIVSIRWVAFPNASNPKLEGTTDIALSPEKKFKAEAIDRNELPAKIEHNNLNTSTPLLYHASITANPPKRRKLQSNGTIDKQIQIKMEPKSPSQGLMKTEEEPLSDNEYAVQIKQELIELNTNVPKIPREAYDEICKFRGNMVRKFPKKERSAKEQERRDKNTFACRRSRRVKKIEQVAVEEEYKGYKDTHLRLTEYAIRAAAYFKELMNRTEEEMSDIIVVD